MADRDEPLVFGEKTNRAYERALATASARPLGEHQVDTIKFMLSMEVEPKPEGTRKLKRGGIVASDMGLGKTYCAIMTMLGNEDLSTLIIVPKTLVTQWTRELAKYGEIYPFRIHRSTRSIPDSVQVVLMTVPEFMSNSRRKLVAGRTWGRIIIDEAHRIRNQNSKMFEYLMPERIGKVKETRDVKSFVKWALTGTPLQNRKKDIEALFAWIGIQVGKVDRSLSRHYKRWSQQQVSAMNTKAALQDIEFHDIEVTPVHQGEINMIRYWEDEFCLQNEKNGGSVDDLESASGELLIALQRCRQAATHPSLPIIGIASKDMRDYNGKTTDSDDEDEETNMKTTVQRRAAVLRHPIRDGDFSVCDMDKLKAISPALSECFQPAERLRSTKLEKMCDLIAAHPSEKTLVFCHWQKEMLAIQQLLEKKRIPTLMFDGQLTDSERASVIKNFEHTPVSSRGMVLIMQFECGSLGLNLTSASRIYFGTPHWNPFIELQALARAHRYGQTKRVVCTRLWVKGTIEERVRQLQQRKLGIVKEVLNDSSFEERFHDKAIDDVNYVFQSKLKQKRERDREEARAKEEATATADNKTEDGTDGVVTTVVTEEEHVVKRRKVTTTTTKKTTVKKAAAAAGSKFVSLGQISLDGSDDDEW